MKELTRLFIEGTSRAPQIDFDNLSGELTLSGRSIPENAAKIYEPLLDWVHKYLNAPCNTTNLRLNLVYFNTVSTIWIAKLIKVLSSISGSDYVLFIHLYLDIEDKESFQEDEVRDIIGSLTDNIANPAISIGVKIHSIDETGKIVKESLVFI